MSPAPGRSAIVAVRSRERPSYRRSSCSPRLLRQFALPCYFVRTSGLRPHRKEGRRGVGVYLPRVLQVSFVQPVGLGILTPAGSPVAVCGVYRGRLLFQWRGDMKHETRSLLVGALFVTVVGAGCSTKKYQVQIDDQQVRIDEAQQRIAQLESEKQDLDQRLNQTRSALEQAQQENEQLGASIAELESNLADLRRQKDEEIEKLTSDSAAEAEAAARRIRGLNSQIRRLQGEIEDKDTQGATKDAGIAELEARGPPTRFRDRVPAGSDRVPPERERRSLVGPGNRQRQQVEDHHDPGDPPGDLRGDHHRRVLPSEEGQRLIGRSRRSGQSQRLSAGARFAAARFSRVVACGRWPTQAAETVPLPITETPDTARCLAAVPTRRTNGHHGRRRFASRGASPAARPLTVPPRGHTLRGTR